MNLSSKINQIEKKLGALANPQNALSRVMKELPNVLGCLERFPEALAVVRSALSEAVLHATDPLTLYDTVPVVMAALERFPDARSAVIQETERRIRLMAGST